jgi:SAM-dependent methyltransferase
MQGPGSLSDAWERHAGRWARWARVPGHDIYHEQLNWPAFRGLCPPPGRRTLDVGCGEGRVGRQLAAAGHCVAGIDSSPTLVALAREAGGFEELVCGDSAKLPWPGQSFDLVLAYMSLHDIDDLAGTVAEIGRVLDPGGRFCLAIVHPLNRRTEALENYFDEQRVADDLERGGLSMTFEGIDRPLEAYPQALARAGFVIEELREPRPTAAAVAAAPQLAKAAKRPYFLHMRCVLASDVRAAN